MANDKVVAWIKAARLRTLPLSFSVIIAGSTFAYEYDYLMTTSLGKEFHFDWNILILSLVTTLFLQVLSNFANDYGDAKKGTDNENRIGPERAIQSGALSLKEMKSGIILMSILSLVSGLFLLWISFDGAIDWTFLIFLLLGILSIAAAIKYTVGKGAYGYLALGDLFVFLFFGVLGVCGSFYLYTGEFQEGIMYYGFSFGALSVAVLNLNNMRDRINDEAVGKRTLAVFLGFKYSKYYHLALFIIAWMPYIIRTIKFFPAQLAVFGWLVPIFIFHFFHIVKVFKVQEEKDFDPELKKVALSTFLLSITLFVTILVFVNAN